MYKLPLDEGMWSGEIIFQSSKRLNINQKTTCQLEIIQSINQLDVKGSVKLLDQLDEYGFSLFITLFELSSNMTTWQYNDSKFGRIWGKLVLIKESYLALGITEDNQYSFTFSIDSVDSTVKIVKGFTLYDRENILSWSVRLNKTGSLIQYQSDIGRPNTPDQSKLAEMIKDQNTFS